MVSFTVCELYLSKAIIKQIWIKLTVPEYPKMLNFIFLNFFKFFWLQLMCTFLIN